MARVGHSDGRRMGMACLGMGKIGVFLPYLARKKREEMEERRKKREKRADGKRTMDRKMAMSDLEMEMEIEIEKRDFGAVREHVTR